MEAIMKELKRVARKICIGAHNAIMDIRWAEPFNKERHVGTRRILKNGVWVDNKGNLYNCTGKCVGKIQWNKGYGANH